MEKCYKLHEFVRAVYEQNRFYVGLVGNDKRFAKPCDPTLVFEEDDKYDIEFEIDNKPHQIKRKEFI